MDVKTYGLYDTVAKTLVNTFNAQNDDVAQRSLEQVIKETKDLSTLKDCVLRYLYTMDTSNGVIIDITQRDIVACAALIDVLPKASIDDKSLASLEENYKKVFNALKTLQDNQKSLDEILSHYQELERKVNDIIGGKIKCQKYKKPRK
jgi:DnaJ-domain-containing protein 1